MELINYENITILLMGLFVGYYLVDKKLLKDFRQNQVSSINEYRTVQEDMIKIFKRINEAMDDGEKERSYLMEKSKEFDKGMEKLNKRDQEAKDEEKAKERKEKKNSKEFKKEEQKNNSKDDRYGI